MQEHFDQDEHRAVVIGLGIAIAISSVFLVMYCWQKANQEYTVGEGSFGNSLAEYRILAASPHDMHKTQDALAKQKPARV